MSTNENAPGPIHWSRATSGAGVTTTRYGFLGTRKDGTSTGHRSKREGWKLGGCRDLYTFDGKILVVPNQTDSTLCYANSEVTDLGNGTTRLQKDDVHSFLEVTPTSRKMPKPDRYLEPSRLKSNSWENVKVQAKELVDQPRGGSKSSVDPSGGSKKSGGQTRTGRGSIAQELAGEIQFAYIQ